MNPSVLSSKHRRELRNYAREYRSRGVIGTYWDLMLAVEHALRIDDRNRTKGGPNGR